MTWPTNPNAAARSDDRPGPRLTPPSVPATTPTRVAGTAGTEPGMLRAPAVFGQLPRRRPGAHLASELSAAGDEAQPGASGRRPAPPVAPRYSPPSPDILHRLLEGLRNLK